MINHQYRSGSETNGLQQVRSSSGLRIAPASVFGGNTGRRGPAQEGRSPLWLHAYTVLLAFAIWVLIFSGGLVTSKGVGLSVPDWPTTYGYNMFAFPMSRWVGGIFYEHSHRLLASAVGFMTIILTISLWRSEKRRWLCWLGVAALIAVILQGVLGGLRVVWLKDQIGIFHACLAQAFLALVSFIALATSRWWGSLGITSLSPGQRAKVRHLAWLVAGIVVLIYMQLALGAAMRHAHAGLSIRDFPTAYGHWWPATDPATVDAINQQRAALELPVTSRGLILLQMIHRLGALAVATGVVVLAVRTMKISTDLEPRLRRLASTGVVLIGLQIALGVYTIWTNKAADIATSHVAVGAASLVWAVLTLAGLLRWSRSTPGSEVPIPSVQTRLVEVPVSR